MGYSIENGWYIGLMFLKSSNLEKIPVLLLELMNNLGLKLFPFLIIQHIACDFLTLRALRQLVPASSQGREASRLLLTRNSDELSTKH